MSNPRDEQPSFSGDTQIQVNIRGSISELNNDLMERMQLLMTSIGSEVTSELDKRIKRAEGHVDKRIEQLAEHLSKKATAICRRREILALQSTSPSGTSSAPAGASSSPSGTSSSSSGTSSPSLGVSSPSPLALQH